MAKAPLMAPVTTDISPACCVDKSGWLNAHSMQRIYITVITSIIRRGMIFQASIFSMSNLYVDVRSLRSVSSSLAAKPIIRFLQIKSLLCQCLKMAVISSMLFLYTLLRKVRLDPLTRLCLLMNI